MNHPEEIITIEDEIRQAIQAGNYAVDTPKAEMKEMFPDWSQWRHDRMGIENLSAAAQKSIKESQKVDEDKSKLFAEKVGGSTSQKWGLKISIPGLVGESIADAILPQSTEWKVGSGPPQSFYNKHTSDLTDELGYQINLQHRSRKNLEGLSENRADFMIAHDHNWTEDEEPTWLFENIDQTKRDMKKSRDSINTIFANAPTESIETLLLKAADKDYDFERISDYFGDEDMQKEMEGKNYKKRKNTAMTQHSAAKEMALARLPLKEEFSRGKPLYTFPDKIFEHYIRNYSKDSGGSVFARTDPKRTKTGFNSKRFAKRSQSDFIEKYRKGASTFSNELWGIFGAKSSLSEDPNDRPDLAYTLMHETGHLTGKQLPGGPLLPGQHDLRPEEQRTDYNAYKELIEAGVVEPTHANLRAIREGHNAGWVERDTPIKQITGPFKGDDPAKFFYENEFTGKWKAGPATLGIAMTGQDTREFGSTKFYEKLQSMVGMTKEERFAFYDRWSKNMEEQEVDGGWKMKDIKRFDKYYFGKHNRLEAKASWYKNVIQKLVDEYSVK